MYRLYDYLPSGNSYKPRLLLSLLGIDYERIDVDIMKGANPHAGVSGQKPERPHPGAGTRRRSKFLWESNAILYYLARLGTPYMPTDPLPAAQVMQWMFFEQYSHEPFIAVARFILMHTDEDHPRRAELEAKMIGGYAALDVMEKHLAGRDYFVGDSMTIADIALYAYTHVADEGNFDLTPYVTCPRMADSCRRSSGSYPDYGCVIRVNFWRATRSE